MCVCVSGLHHERKYTLERLKYAVQEGEQIYIFHGINLLCVAPSLFCLPYASRCHQSDIHAKAKISQTIAEHKEMKGVMQDTFWA